LQSKIFECQTPTVLNAFRTFSSPEYPIEKLTKKQDSLKVSLKNDRLKLDRAFYGNFKNPILKSLNFPSLKENLCPKTF